VYLIPVIAALVVIAAFVLLLVVMCERRRRRQRERHRRQTYEETAKLKRRDSEDGDGDGVETASEASRGVRKEDSFTELRDIEPEEIDVSVIEPTERAVSRSSIEVLSPARSPREHGARDEWRRREILNLQRKSSEEIIV
jgi:flagellar biosynthesis/type III secretory pathway M-ring protein FliF/YscJ